MRFPRNHPQEAVRGAVCSGACHAKVRLLLFRRVCSNSELCKSKFEDLGMDELWRMSRIVSVLVFLVVFEVPAY